jgi:hypothetical protein
MHPGHNAYGVTGRQWDGNSPPHLQAAPTPKARGDGDEAFRCQGVLTVVEENLLASKQRGFGRGCGFRCQTVLVRKTTYHRNCGDVDEVSDFDARAFWREKLTRVKTPLWQQGADQRNHSPQNTPRTQ